MPMFCSMPATRAAVAPNSSRPNCWRSRVGEVLPEVGEFGGRDDPLEGREDHSVLAGLVRLVGAPGRREGARGEDQPPPLLQLLGQLPGQLGHVVVWQRRGQRLETELAEGSPELHVQRTVTSTCSNRAGQDRNIGARPSRSYCHPATTDISSGRAGASATAAQGCRSHR